MYFFTVSLQCYTVVLNCLRFQGGADVKYNITVLRHFLDEIVFDAGQSYTCTNAAEIIDHKT